MKFRLDGSAVDEHNGVNGVVTLLLFEGGTETVHTGIAVEEKRAGVVDDGVPVGVDEDRERGQLGEQFPHNGFHGRSKDEIDALFEKGCAGPYPLRVSVSPYRAEIPCNRKNHPIRSVADLGLGMGISIIDSTFLALGMIPAGEMWPRDVAEEIRVRDADGGL